MRKSDARCMLGSSGTDLLFLVQVRIYPSPARQSRKVILVSRVGEVFMRWEKPALDGRSLAGSLDSLGAVRGLDPDIARVVQVHIDHLSSLLPILEHAICIDHEHEHDLSVATSDEMPRGADSPWIFQMTLTLIPCSFSPATSPSPASSAAAPVRS